MAEGQSVGHYYPYLGFHFKVEFGGLISKNDIRFQSVDGLNVEMETETIKEGGENRFEHTVPVRTKYSNLVLKRGVFRPDDSFVTEWIMLNFQHMVISPIDMLVTLLDETNKPLVNWQIMNAYPVNWKVSPLDAEKGSIVVESLELSYNYFNYYA